jgi:hypothetical protein
MYVLIINKALILSFIESINFAFVDLIRLEDILKRDSSN